MKRIKLPTGVKIRLLPVQQIDDNFQKFWVLPKNEFDVSIKKGTSVLTIQLVMLAHQNKN